MSNYSVNYGITDIFDGRPYYYTEPSTKISVADKDYGYFGSVVDHYSRKTYTLETGILTVNTSNVARNDKATKAMQAVMNFIDEHDVFQNAFKIISLSSFEGITRVYFNAYIAKGASK